MLHKENSLKNHPNENVIFGLLNLFFGQDRGHV